MKLLIAFLVPLGLMAQEVKPAITKSVLKIGQIEARQSAEKYQLDAGWIKSTGGLRLYDRHTIQPHISLDDFAKYNFKSLIIRNANSEPIAFCNIVKQRCWALK